MASQDKRSGGDFDVSLLEGLRERVGRDNGPEDELLSPRSAKKSLLFGALIGLAAAAGAAWYILGSGSGQPSTGPQEVPVVKAEKAPIKVRPADPGGMEVPNQDKTVYDRVAKGSSGGKSEVEHLLPQPASPKDLPKSADGLGDGMAPLPPPLPDAAKPVEAAKVTPPLSVATKSAEPAKPAAAPVAPVAKLETPKPATPAASASGGAWQIQIAAVKEEARAKSEWDRAVKAVPSVLSALPHEVVRADLGAKGVFYRLRAGGYASREQAEQVCESLKAKGIGCVAAKR
jgi:hypothetical protein